jgi:hypothetical protein
VPCFCQVARYINSPPLPEEGSWTSVPGQNGSLRISRFNSSDQVF